MNKFLTQGLFALLLSAGLTSAALAADTYTVDPAHSRMGFSVKHLTINEVQGEFSSFDGSITLDKENPTQNKFSAKIQAGSIDTGNEQRDGHLRQTDFFDAEKFKDITFESTKVTVEDNLYTVTGNLTIKGVTKPVTIPLTLSGPVKNPMNGVEVIAFKGQIMINRQDFGVKWNKQMDHGGVLVSDDVVIAVDLEAKK